MRFRSVRAAALAGAAIALTSSAAVAAAADNSPEVVVVTGSYISGAAEQTALPVRVITSDDLKKQGSPSMTDLIKDLPSSSGVYGDANQFGAGRTEGSSSVNLRTLGQQRTLVLINGRRMVISSAGTVPFVDMNNIPIAAIGRLEVLKDGAAATYGSDAIGGVVNVITRTDLDGLELGGDYTFIDGSDGDYTARAAFGWNDDKVHFFAAGGYQHRSVLPATARDFVTPKYSTQAGAMAAYLHNPQGGWSSAANPGAYLNATTFGNVGDVGCQNDWSGELPLSLATPAASYRCLFRYADFDHLVERQDQWQGYTSVDVDLPHDIKLHLEGLYARAAIFDVTQSVTYGPNQYPGCGAGAPGCASPGATQAPGALLQYFFIPQTNPGLVAMKAYAATLPATNTAAAAWAAVGAGLYANPFFQRPMAVGGNPLFNFGGQGGERTNNTYRLMGDLSGSFGGWLSGTAWDVAATLAQSNAVQVTPDFLVDRLELALRGFGSLAGGTTCNPATATPGNAAQGCYYFNPFSNSVATNAITGAANPGFNAALTNSAQLVNWIYGPDPQKTDATNRLFVIDAVVNGEIGAFSLPGGKIGWAAGFQYRDGDFIFNADGFTNNSQYPCVDSVYAGASASCSITNGPYTFYGNYTPITTHQTVKAVFGELTLPVFDTLNVDLALRHEVLGAAGSTTNPKASVRWQALDWFALRGSVGTTFRAPPAATQFGGAVTGLAFTAQAGRYTPFDTFANPLLAPEKATTFNLGGIFTADAFTATLDYWNFDFQNPLTTESGLNILNAIFPTAGVGNCANPAYAALITRVTFTGGVCNSANILRTKIFNINGAPVHTSGIDFAADYLWDDTPIIGGTLDAHLDGTYVIRYHVGSQLVEGIVTTPAYNAAGKLNYLLSVSSLPNWKGNLTFTWTGGPHMVQLAGHYIGGMSDAIQRPTIFTSTNNGFGVVTSGARVGAFITADLHYRFNWEAQGLELNADIVNLFDQDPPFARLDYSYDPFTANPLGRTFKIGISAKL